MYESYMARLKIKNGHQKNFVSWWDWTRCSKYRYHSRFNSEHNWEGLCDRSKRKRICTLTSSNFCISTPTLKLKNANLRDSQFLTWRSNSWSNPMAQIVFGFRSAHNRPTHLNRRALLIYQYNAQQCRSSESQMALKANRQEEINYHQILE